MGDLNIETMYMCRSNEHWQRKVEGSKGAVHTVSFGRHGHKDQTCVMGYSCTCPAFKYRPGDCKHIKAVKGQRCGWHQQMDGGAPTKRGRCPRCNGEVVAIRVGV